MHRRHRHLHRRTAVFIHARQHFHRYAAAGLAVVSCIGNIGGFVAPYAVGVLNDLTGSSAPGLFFLASCLLATGLICIFYCAKQREGVINA